MKKLLNTFNSKDLVEVSTVPGFYHIPGTTRYALNKEGRLYSFLRKKVLPVRELDPTVRYRSTVISHESGKNITFPTHRLLALMFINDGTDKSKMQVDHIDGDRFNNKLDNLEWVTPSENVLRSFRLGLRDNSAVSVVVYNPKTKEKRVFYCLGYAAYVLGLHYSSISSRCKHEGKRVYPDGYQYMFGDENTVFPDISEITDKYGVELPVVTRNALTGEILHFKTSKDACIAHSYSPAMMSSYLNDDRQLLTEDLIQIKPDDGTPWREIKDPYLDLKETSQYQPVTITDVVTGKQHHFVSASLAAQFANILTTTLHWRLIDPDAGKKVYQPGYTFKYYDGK
nr:MAG TPA: homing endonuclease [Bacteriophage sp.]